MQPSCRSESCSVPPFARMILPALNTYGHVMAGYPFFVTQSGRHGNPLECTKMVPSDPKLNALQGTGLGIWKGRLVFPLFLNEMTKNVNFLQSFNIFPLSHRFMTSFLGASMQNRGSFKSMWHSKCDESYRESIAQLHRTWWAKNRI